MKKLLVLVPIAAFAAFAWWSLPPPQQGQAGGAAPITANGKDVVQLFDKGRGVVQYVDKARGVVMIKHGALPALNMTPMTMSYPVEDPSQLANLQPAQEVEFQVSYDGEDYLITDIK